MALHILQLTFHFFVWCIFLCVNLLILTKMFMSDNVRQVNKELLLVALLLTLSGLVRFSTGLTNVLSSAFCCNKEIKTNPLRFS